MIVLKLGGSVLFPNGIDTQNVKKLKGLLPKLKSPALVVGGGKFNSVYAAQLRELKASEAFSDLVGIDFSRTNARIIAHLVQGTYVEDFHQALYAKLPVLGGQTPGQSTDAVAAVLAELLGAKLVLVKDVGGIYTSNPKKDPKAALIKRMTFEELLDFSGKEDFGAKSYGVMDLQACRVVARSRIPTYVCGLDTIEPCLAGKAGTVING